MRTKGVARITAEDAIALGASGPTLRGSGVDFDLRRDMPYSGLRKLQIQKCQWRRKAMCSRGKICRVQELRESIAIVQQALDGMPEGPIKADAPKVVLPDREKMKTQMEALIYHFKIITEGFAVPAGEVLSSGGVAAWRNGVLHRERRDSEAVSCAHAGGLLGESASAAEDVRRAVAGGCRGGNWVDRYCARGN